MVKGKGKIISDQIPIFDPSTSYFVAGNVQAPTLDSISHNQSTFLVNKRDTMTKVIRPSEEVVLEPPIINKALDQHLVSQIVVSNTNPPTMPVKVTGLISNKFSALEGINEANNDTTIHIIDLVAQEVTQTNDTQFALDKKVQRQQVIVASGVVNPKPSPINTTTNGMSLPTTPSSSTLNINHHSKNKSKSSSSKKTHHFH